MAYSFKELRAKHTALIYESFKYERIGSDLRIGFSFTLEPSICLLPSITIPLPEGFAEPEFECFAFHLGLIELISYWKAACPKKIIIRAGKLNTEQIAWWKDLYLHGLGEFFYRNGINCGLRDLLTIEVESKKRISSLCPTGNRW